PAPPSGGAVEGRGEPDGPWRPLVGVVFEGGGSFHRRKKKGPAHRAPARRTEAEDSLETAPDSVCHACTSRPRPYGCAPRGGAWSLGAFYDAGAWRAAVPPLQDTPPRRAPEATGSPAS